MKQVIELSDVLEFQDPSKYKLHLACKSDGIHPLDVYVTNREKWIEWNCWRGSKDDWTRKYILSFIEFYPISHTYLFGGIFEVKVRSGDGYGLGEVDAFKKWEGRLICSFHRYQGLRGRAFNLENLLGSFSIHSILPECYSGERFCGYENINHPFSVLRGIISRGKQDWKAALITVKCVYLIIDTANGRTYIGSAYGDGGVWARLSCYVSTGHGGNDELVKIIKDKGEDYALANFKFSILEVFTPNTPDEVVVGRESHWKNVVLSRKFGYNRN